MLFVLLCGIRLLSQRCAHAFAHKLSKREVARWNRAGGTIFPKIEPRLFSAGDDKAYTLQGRRIRVTPNLQRPLHYWPALLLSLAPPAYICIAIYLYSVNLPQWDEWGLALLHERFANGTLSVSDLFAQFNEYRQFFPNLVFVVVGYLNKGDLRFVMYVSFITACLISYNIYKLSGMTLSLSPSHRWWLLAATNLLIFSPVQAVNWLQGQQLIYFIPGAVLTTCLRIAYSNTSRSRMKLLSCGLLCFISTFSSANGVICWILMVPAILWAPAWVDLRHKAVWLCGWLLSFALCIGMYLNGYRKPPAHPELTHVFAHPAQDLFYWLSLLGRPLFGRIFLSAATGALLIALFLWATGIYLRHRKSGSEIVDGMLCWLILGAYSIITALLITVGRAGFGISQSLSARYATFTVLLTVAVLCIFIPRLWSNPRISAFGPRKATWAAVVIALLILTHVRLYVYGIRNMKSAQTKLLYQKACVHFINLIADDCQRDVLPDVAQLRRFANILDQLGYLDPPLPTIGVLNDTATTDALGAENYGSFTGFEATGKSEYTASGLAGLPYRQAPADAVLLACENSNRDAKIIGVAGVLTTRESISSTEGVYDGARWSKSIDIRALPTMACTMTAWAFDANSGKAFKLSGAYTVDENQ